MDRLTEYVDGEARHVQTGKVGYKDCLKKLAEYEDTGLEPEEIRKVLTDNAKVILESASAEEQNGRLLKENEMLHELVKLAVGTFQKLIDEDKIICDACSKHEKNSSGLTTASLCPCCGAQMREDSEALGNEKT
jgi:tRNA(Ile2) C34 agmatinyltransferase TiaS